MFTFLVILLVILMALTLFSLIRGVVAFLQTTKIDLQSGDAQNATEMQLAQNKMMMSRIKYQTLAIVVVVVMMLATR